MGDENMRRKSENLPRTELELWVHRISQAQTRLTTLLERIPEDRKPVLSQTNPVKPAKATKALLRQKSQSLLVE
jgi:hypothetical protein